MGSRRRGKALLIAVAAVVVAGLVYGKVKVDRLERDALLLASTGRELIRFFGEWAEATGPAGDEQRLMSFYDRPLEAADRPLEAADSFGWRRVLRSATDGVEVFDWVADGVSDETRPAEVLTSKLKLARLEEIETPDRVTAQAVHWWRARRDDGRLEETRQRFRFKLERGAEGWKIRHQELIDGSTVVGDGAGFVDVAAEVRLDFRARMNPVFETDEWRLERFAIAKYSSAGASAVDYDGDGWYDLFLADGAGFRLYRNLGAAGRMAFADVTADAGLPVDFNGAHVGLFADFDGDGDADLFLGRIAEGSRLFRNQGDGTFEDASAGIEVDKPFITSAAAADYDADGDLDLVVGRYLDPRVDLPTTLFYTRNGQGTGLWRNDGDLRFTDVTAEAGITETGLSLGTAFGDYDRDGDPDLYIANDFGRNALLRNEGDGTFADVSAETGTLDIGYGMSSSFGDVDNDGDLDLYVSNVHSGQRWYGQATTLYKYLLTSLRQGTAWEDSPLYREIFGYAGADWRHLGDGVTKGNSLLLNDGSGHFTDVAEAAGANPFGWYWGSTFLDYDNDGRLDVYAANGWISGKSHDDL